MSRALNLALASLLISLGAYRYAPDSYFKSSLTFTFFSVYSSILVAWYVWSAYVYPKYFSPFRNLPQPPGGRPLTGHYLRIMAEPKESVHSEWIETIPNNGIIAVRGIFNEERVVPTDPKAMAEVLTSKAYDYGKPSFVRHALIRILGDGILLVEGEEHKRQRKLLMPAFAFRHVKELYSVFWAKSRELVQGIEREVEAGKLKEKELGNLDEKGKAEKRPGVDVGNWASRATLDIIGAAGIGKDFGSLKDPNNELNRAYRAVFEPNRAAQILLLVRIFISAWLARHVPIQRNYDVQHASKLIRRTCHELISDKRRRMAEGKSSGIDILSVALEGGGFTDDDIINQLMTFLTAGHESTSSALTWAIYLMCKHPEMQSRLRAEVRENLPSIADDSRCPDAAEVDRLPYLNAFCQEVLRLMPPVHVTIRAAREDTMLVGHLIPKDTVLSIPIGAFNRNPALWGPDAKTFNPERWMEPGKANTGGAKSNYAYMTFLHGPRSCIGQSFAKGEFACLLAAWAGRFETTFAGEPYEAEYAAGVTIKPKGGLKVKVKPLEGW